MAVANALSKARDAAHSLLKAQSWRQSSNSVHDLRVALYRLMVANSALADLIPKKVRRKFKRRIRKLRRSAAQIRDDDVFHDAVTDLARQTSTYGVASAIIRKQLKQSRIQLLQELRQAIERQEDDAFWDWAERKLLSRLRAQQVPEALLQHIALDKVASKLKKLVSRLSVAIANEDPDPHAVRIAAKQLRYTLELFADCLESVPAAELRSVMMNLQDLLGHVHDATIFTSRCAHWVKDTNLSQAERAELEKMATAFQDRRYQWATLDRRS